MNFNYVIVTLLVFVILLIVLFNNSHNKKIIIICNTSLVTNILFNFVFSLTFHSLRKISSVLTTRSVDLRNSTKHELASHLTDVLAEYCNTCIGMYRQAITLCILL